MIGHIFTSSGAVCLALAPRDDSVGEYAIIAKTENEYAVATLGIASLPAPEAWSHATYYGPLEDAVEEFRTVTGITDTETLTKQIEYAVGIVSALLTHHSSRAAALANGATPAL